MHCRITRQPSRRIAVTRRDQVRPDDMDLLKDVVLRHRSSQRKCNAVHITAPGPRLPRSIAQGFTGFERDPGRVFQLQIRGRRNQLHVILRRLTRIVSPGDSDLHVLRFRPRHRADQRKRQYAMRVLHYGDYIHRNAAESLSQDLYRHVSSS